MTKTPIIVEITKEVQDYLLKADKDGRQDGNISADSSLNRLESLKSKFQALLIKIHSYAVQETVKLKDQFITLSSEIKEIDNRNDDRYVEEKIERLTNEKDKNISELQALYESTSRRIGSNLNDLDDLKRELKSEEIELRKNINELKFDRSINPRWGIMLIIILSILEIPFTYSGLLVLRTSSAFTVSISILFAIILILGAHFIGKSIKAKKDIIIHSIFFVLCFCVIVALAFFRTIHVNKLPVDSSAFWRIDNIFFTVLGLGIFFSCLVISYYAANSNVGEDKKKKELMLRQKLVKERLKNIDKDTKNCEEQFSKCNTDFKENKGKLERDYEREVDDIKSNTKRQAKVRERMSITTAHNSIVEKCKLTENEVIEKYNDAVATYRRAYLDAKTRVNGEEKMEEKFDEFKKNVGQLVPQMASMKHLEPENN